MPATDDWITLERSHARFDLQLLALWHPAAADAPRPAGSPDPLRPLCELARCRDPRVAPRASCPGATEPADAAAGGAGRTGRDRAGGRRPCRGPRLGASTGPC